MTPATEPATRFAPAGRAERSALERQADYFAEQSFTRHLLDAVPSFLAILNQERQIVFANQALLRLVGAAQEAEVRGLRPGEVLDCLNAGKGLDGCGTGEACSTCGAVLAILAGLAGREETRECRLSTCRGGHHEALDLRVSATPLEYAGESFTVVTADDISHEKRRRSLERLFFHDILNLLGSIRGFAELLRDYEPKEKQEIFSLMHSAAQQTIEEIEAQRLLSAAEAGELVVNPEPVGLASFLHQTVEIYRFHEAAKGRQLVLAEAPAAELRTDRLLLGRILGNMIKNALEACRPGETVTVGGACDGDRIGVWVHNPTFIPKTVQHQIFQRSFSTKGSGRGLGTYSMKLLGDYLRGEVEFTSSETEGTTFRGWFPLPG